MKAIAYSKFGGPDVLRCEELAVPAPGEREVLIEVRASSVNPADWHFMRGTPIVGRIAFGLFAPRIERLGIDVAGVVRAVGKNVARFKEGDDVFGSCRGAFAEYACTKESALAAKPANMTFAQAGTVAVAGETALQGLRDKAHVHAGQRVLINGAAGGVGTFAVQIAKAFGAHVTGVCSTRNIGLVRSIGADRVIDYTEEDFTKSPERYDVILDAIGNHAFSPLRRVLNPKGVCLMVGGPSGRWIAPIPSSLVKLARSRLVSQKFVGYIGTTKCDDLEWMSQMMAAGTITPVIDRHFSLNDIAEAMRYVETGHARGKVVIDIPDTHS